MQDAARLHLKWNEFLSVYGGPKSRIDDLNKAAPGFFFLTQNAGRHDIILHIFRMTDENRKVLSIPKLKVPPGLANEFKGKLSMLKTASKFAHTLRNHYIAHRNREVALQVRPVPDSSVRQIRMAIAAIDDALHLIDNHFTSREPTMYEHLDMVGGANSLIWIIRRGLKARSNDLENHRPMMRFDE